MWYDHDWATVISRFSVTKNLEVERFFNYLVKTKGCGD